MPAAMTLTPKNKILKKNYYPIILASKALFIANLALNSSHLKVINYFIFTIIVVFKVSLI
jgi:hypothetical protein